jgi:AcrR family transcriptional regulator
MPPRVKKDTVERRTEILETTRRIVVERGFGTTRIADVADALGVSTGLIHYHFDSKDQLLAEAFRFAAAEDLARLADEIRLYAPERSEPSWRLWIDTWGEALRTPALAQISQDLDEQWKDQLQSVIEFGVAAGEFRCDDPRGAAWRLAALLDGLAVQVTVHDGVVSQRELRAWVQHAAIVELGLPADAFARRRAPARRASVGR